MDFVIGFNEVGSLDHGRVTKFVFLSASNEALGTRPNRSLKKLRVFAFKPGLPSRNVCTPNAMSLAKEVCSKRAREIRSSGLK